jgi:hypothetical protein
MEDQDTVNVMGLIEFTKYDLENWWHDSEWIAFLEEVNSFCVKYRVEVAGMDFSSISLLEDIKVLKKYASLPCG